MFFKKFDSLSSKVTLYYDGNIRHQSMISGILTFLCYFGIIFVIIMYLTELFGRKTQTSFYYKKFQKDVGSFEALSEMFHYVTIGKDEIDYKAVQIIGAQMATAGFLSFYVVKNSSNLFKFPHSVGEKIHIQGLWHCRLPDVREWRQTVHDFGN